MDKKIFVEYKIGLPLIDINQIFPMKLLEIKFPFQSKVMIKKLLKIAEKRIIS